jgi:LysM repeat protein
MQPSLRIKEFPSTQEAGSLAFCESGRSGSIGGLVPAKRRTQNRASHSTWTRRHVYHTAVPFLLIRDSTATPTHACFTYSDDTPLPPTLTPTVKATRAPHSLDVVIGEQDKFIIHRVSSGESIQLFATQHNTTPDVIKSMNHNLVVPIWVDSIINIPLDRRDPGDLPAFEPYGIAEKGLTLRDIAIKFDVDLETLSQYNNLLPEDVLEPGEWVLIPRERTYWYRY